APRRAACVLSGGLPSPAARPRPAEADRRRDRLDTRPQGRPAFRLRSGRRHLARPAGLTPAASGLSPRSDSRYLGRAGPVAQLDRASPSEGEGRTFESCRVRQSFQDVTAIQPRWVEAIATT